MRSSSSRAAQILAVIRVASGNFLEMFDFFVFGYYAADIGHTFFPSASAFASLLSSFMTFGAGFLMRPLGAIVLGAYIDKHGRRAGLLLTLGLMALGILMIAFVPGYASWGWFAPLIVVLGRLIQGFSAGVELGGVSIYLSEIAPKSRRGFYVSWQSGSQQVAVMVVALLGVAINATLAPQQVSGWGWRIPFVIGCLIVPLLFLLRRGLTETDEFLAQPHHATVTEIFHGVARHWRLVLTGMFMVTMTTVSFYFITAYTPTFGTAVLHLRSTDSLLVTLCVGLSNLFWLPVMGALSDRVGRRPLLLLFTVLMLVSAYPVLSWLVAAPSFARLMAVELWLSFLYGSYNGAMVVALAEIMPSSVRTSAFAFAYSLATALFGGFTPAISTYLIHVTENRAVPGLWLTFAALCGLGAAWTLARHPALRPARAA
jgi:MHS family citrate/tricarballylate:H+ symporter-like MFS transporter